MVETVEKMADRMRPLPPKDLEYGIHAYQQMSIRVDAGTTKEQLESHEFWAFVTTKMLEGSEIRILPRDMAYRAQAIVTFNDGKNLRVEVFDWVDLNAANQNMKMAPNIAKSYRIVLRGQNKMCIQRLGDGEWIKEHIPTKNEAVVWLDKYLLALDGDADAVKWMEDCGF